MDEPVNPEDLKSGSTCVCGELCLHEGDARKRVRRATPEPGYRYQALPCRKTRWWHVYVARTGNPTKAVQKKIDKRAGELRRKVEGG
jgi:hypothetical protein